MLAGIKYFEYLDGGYEGTVSRSIPNDLQSNLNYLMAAETAGAYGIFWMKFPVSLMRLHSVTYNSIQNSPYTRAEGCI